MKIDYVTIFTSKLDESIAFYTDVLGFEYSKTVDAGGGVKLAFLHDGNGGNLELVDNGQEVPVSKDCPVAITVIVEDMAATEAMVDGKGIAKTFGPMKMPSGVTLMHIQDPQGVTINFVHMGEGHF